MALALLCGCQDIVQQVPTPVATDLTGEWDFTIVLPPDEAVPCRTVGSLVLAQQDSLFTGTATRAAGNCGLPVLGAVTAGVVSDTVVRFTAGSCAFEGAFPRTPTDSVAGVVVCGWGSGTWDAVRVGAPHQVTVEPFSRALSVGGSQRLVATLLDSAGHVLYGRPFAWHSGDTLVATVDTTGLVRAVGTGQVTITATAAGVFSGAAITVGSTAFTMVDAGGEFTCARATDGGAWCWGPNDDGELGDGSLLLSAAPVPVHGPAFTTVTAGYAHACGLDAAGQAWCWGSNGSGRLGDGTTTSRSVPVPVADSLLFSSLVAGAWHTCGLTAGGQAWCWGWGGNGQLGDSTRQQRTRPVAVKHAPPFASLALGHETTCGLTSAGAAWCWGANPWGMTGTGVQDTAILVPLPVLGGHTFTAITVGRLHMCGVTPGGDAYCWGDGVYGQLGNGARGRVSTPTLVAGGHTWSQVVTSEGHTCGVDTAGAAWCWGGNGAGQGGHAAGTEVDVPTAVVGGLTFGALTTGLQHTCGRATDGVVWCWGGNFRGQLGDGTRVDRHQPVRVAGQP